MPHMINPSKLTLSRSDSKNPDTTCRGTTANGLPCRRGLALSPNSSPPRGAVKSRTQQKADITAFYCWQHKDQAEAVLRRTTWTPESRQEQPRTSIDTLMDRLGVLEINDTQHALPPQKHNHVMKKNKTKRSFCCFDIIEDDEPLPPKLHRPTGSHTQPPQMHEVSLLIPTRPEPKPKPHTQRAPIKPIPNKSLSIAQTKSLLSWIPASLSPQSTSLLLAELARPISTADEPGYIYMFWVTPSISNRCQPPPSDVASSLLPSAETNTDTPDHILRTRTAISKARDPNTLTSKPRGSSPGTVRLKIGRTSNVQRRLNEWTRQCSNHLTLIRYYPYTSSTGREQGQGMGTAGLEPGRKVPHVHRVERLIHIELAGIRARDMGVCQECGKEHREWFEVAAERAALKSVDECIRRWVRWAYSQ
ncbi:uncharacterized protein BJX67DRAFT_64866 [Aspergillus lucknowensis]|uniref:Meiotically up-regulated gene 113-domain-containing protein n=1 Tax=Aspergillus lucknowensis TaxID=176173 RepID=A0ABR4LUH9_9EURO